MVRECARRCPERADCQLAGSSWNLSAVDVLQAQPRFDVAKLTVPHVGEYFTAEDTGCSAARLI